MLIIYNYQTIDKGGFNSIVSMGPRLCPVCGGKMTVRDSRKRTVITAQGPRIYRLRRLRCPVCCRIHLEIPSCILPYRRYSQRLVEQSIHGNTSGCPAKNSTIYRWRKAEEQMRQRYFFAGHMLKKQHLWGVLLNCHITENWHSQRIFSSFSRRQGFSNLEKALFLCILYGIQRHFL